MATALITGATAGIGNSFARLLAAQGYDLVLVARDEARLHRLADELHAQYGVHAEPFRADLARYDECAWVEQRLSDGNRPIEVLINNAGYGLNARFVGDTMLAEQGMFDVLARAVLRLSHAAVGGMVQRGSGTIINVTSVAAWWHRSTYSAAKSYVLVLSKSLRQEVKRNGVNVTALCPGFTRTEFHARGAFDMRRMPKFMWLDADRVAADAWSDSQKGRAVSVPGKLYKAMHWLMKFSA